MNWRRFIKKKVRLPGCIFNTRKKKELKVNSKNKEEQNVIQHSVHWGINPPPPQKYHPVFIAKLPP